MPSRENIINIVNRLPVYKLEYARAYLEGLIADEEADDLFCRKLVEDYENDPDPDKDECYNLEEIYDRKAFEEAMEEFRKNPITYTHKEVWGEFGL